MGMVDSPIKAKPPVPDDRFIASWFASRRKTPIATITKHPLASRAMVARLRLLRRAESRTPGPPRVNRPVVFDNVLSHRAVKARPDSSNNEPAPKNAPASPPPFRKDQTTMPIAASPQRRAIQNDRK